MVHSESLLFGGEGVGSYLERLKKTMKLHLPSTAAVNWEWAACVQDRELSSPGTTKLILMWCIKLEASR